MTMSKELLDIQPRDLCFPVEPKKQSLCTIQLTNKSDKHVAFKVKTTSPKKYCVRPNVGIVKPNGKSGFTVMMQVQRDAPLDLQCKDKFLIQSTVVPSGTAEEDITSDMFAKNSGKQIEERKLRVILVCLPQSPVLSPVNGVANQGFSRDISQNDMLHLLPLHKESEGFKLAKTVDDSRLISDAENLVTDGANELPKLPITISIDAREVISVENIELPSMEMEDDTKEFEELKSKIDVLGSKLAEAEPTVVKRTEERTNSLQALQASEMAEQELESKGFKMEKTMDDSTLIIDAENAVIDDANVLPIARSIDAREVETVEKINFPRMEMEDDLKKPFEELTSKIDLLESKLAQTEQTVAKLTEERTKSMQASEILERELALMKLKVGVKTVYMGFPPLYVCMVALISHSVGYLMQ